MDLRLSLSLQRHKQPVPMKSNQRPPLAKYQNLAKNLMIRRTGHPFEAEDGGGHRGGATPENKNKSDLVELWRIWKENCAGKRRDAQSLKQGWQMPKPRLNQVRRRKACSKGKGRQAK